MITEEEYKQRFGGPPPKDRDEELLQAYRLLLKLNEVAIRRGDIYGFCDAIDNTGEPYPSQWGANILERAAIAVCKADGVPVVQLRSKLV